MGWKDKGICFKDDIKGSESITYLNQAIGYIESQLRNKIAYKELAAYTHYSLYHFQRMFAFAAGIPISEYIRRRRLTLAAFDLQHGNEKVIEIADKYGYSSPTSFCRAFKEMHGISPSTARLKGVALKAFPKMSFKITVKGGDELNYRIEQKESFELFGVQTIISARQSTQEIQQFWAASREDGSITKIKQAAGVPPETPVHAAIYDYTEAQYAYLLCLPLPLNDNAEGFVKLLVPAGEWAVFSTPLLALDEVSEIAAKMWKQIFTEWFIMSGYELGQAPELEMHYNMGANRYKTEIWIPVIKK